MLTFRCQHLKELTRQLAFSPIPKRREQMERAESLYWYLDNDLNYKLDALIFAITQHRPFLTNEDITLVGQAVREDMLVMVEQLSLTFDDSFDQHDPPPLDLDTVATQLNVSKKTISRYRKRGLFAQRLIGPNDRRKLAFLPASVEKFIQSQPDLLQKAANFSHIGQAVRQQMIEKACELVRGDSSLSPYDVIVDLTKSFGRSHESIRSLLIQHDEEYPADLIFPDRSPPLTVVQQREIFTAWHNNVSVLELCQQYQRSRPAIYRAINLRHASALRKIKITCQKSPTFKLPDAAQVILTGNPLPSAKPDAAELEERELHRVSQADLLPVPFLTVLERSVLDASTERTLFVRMNYLKYQVSRQLRSLDRHHPQRVKLDLIETYLRHSFAIKHRLSRDYLKLVIAVAQKHMTGKGKGQKEQLLELVHRGNLVLLDAIDQFDVTKGHRFSATLNWSLVRHYAAPDRWDRPSLALHPVDDLPHWPAVLSPSLHTLLRSSQNAQVYQKLLDPLDELPRQIITWHMGLPEKGDIPNTPITLVQIAEQLGLLPEKAYQIERRGLAHVRENACRLQINLTHFLPTTLPRH